MAKKKPDSPFTGLWHIVSMTGWDEDYFNEEVQAFIEFEANGTGHFQFGYVQGYMDWRPATREHEPCVEWSWEGTDGGVFQVQECGPRKARNPRTGQAVEVPRKLVVTFKPAGRWQFG